MKSTPTPIMGWTGATAQALGHLPHPAISKRRVLWNRFLWRLGFEPKAPPRPKWSIEDGPAVTPDEHWHNLQNETQQVFGVGATQEGIQSAKAILEVVGKVDGRFATS